MVAIITQSEVLQKLDALKAYSVTQDPATETLFAPCYAAVNAYYSTDNAGMTQALEDVVKYMYNDLTRRTTQFEYNFDMRLATDYPTGYDEITNCFYQFAELLGVTEQQFFDAFVYGLPEGSGGGEGGTAQEIPLSNPYLDDWTAEINAAITQDLANVKNLAEWCKNSGGCDDLISLLENRGRIVTQKTVKEKAAIIYYDKKLIDVVNALNLSVYIPSYFKGVQDD